MGEWRDDIGSVIRKEIAAQRRALRERVAARDPSPEAFRLALRRQREAGAAVMRKMAQETPTVAEIDRMLRFEERLNALLDRKKRR